MCTAVVFELVCVVHVPELDLGRTGGEHPASPATTRNWKNGTSLSNGHRSLSRRRDVLTSLYGTCLDSLCYVGRYAAQRILPPTHSRQGGGRMQLRQLGLQIFLPGLKEAPVSEFVHDQCPFPVELSAILLFDISLRFRLEHVPPLASCSWLNSPSPSCTPLKVRPSRM